MNVWLTPAVVVAAFGLALQGGKSAWDLFLSIKQRRTERQVLSFQWLSALLAVAERLPISEGELVEVRLRLLREHLPEEVLGHLRTIVQQVETSLAADAERDLES